MLLFYCDDCGVRITEPDLKSGGAVEADGNRYYCAQCARKSRAPAVVVHASASGHKNKLPDSGAERSGKTRIKVPAKAKNNRLPMLIGLGGGAMVSLAIVFFLATRNPAQPPDPKPADSSSPPSSDTVKPPAQPAVTPPRPPPAATPAPVPPAAANTVKGRYVRISLPGLKRILSLSEVQVFSAGKNAAPKGKATQSSVEHDGAPEKAIDSITSGVFANKSVTHTKEEDNPWWEVDLGREMELEQIVVWNRTDTGLGSRLANFTLEVLDGDRKTVWKRAAQPAPVLNAYFDLSNK